MGVETAKQVPDLDCYPGGTVPLDGLRALVRVFPAAWKRAVKRGSGAISAYEGSAR